MKEILKLADQKSLSSVAFPALGTGQLGYDRSQVAKAMFAAVAEYSSNSPSSKIKEVTFVIFDKDTQTVQVSSSRLLYHSLYRRYMDAVHSCRF